MKSLLSVGKKSSLDPHETTILMGDLSTAHLTMHKVQWSKAAVQGKRSWSRREMSGTRTEDKSSKIASLNWDTLATLQLAKGWVSFF